MYALVAIHIYCRWMVEILSNYVPLYISFHLCVQSHHTDGLKLAAVKIFTPWEWTKWTKSTNLYFVYCFVNCLTLFLDAFVLSRFSCFWLFVTPRTVACQDRGNPCPWDFPGKNTGVGCHILLQGIFLITPTSFTSPALAGGFLTPGATWEAPVFFNLSTIDICSSTIPCSRRMHRAP